MEKERRPTKELFTWPIPAGLIDIQTYFPAWYNWARTQCGVQSLSDRNDMENTQQPHQQSSCHCHPPSPYKINELWSLQNAFMYGCNLFIDKSCTLSHWSLSLSSRDSSLPHVDRMKMIHYATHDVMAVTFLIRPITEKWTFRKIENRKMNEMFIAFNSTKLPPLLTSKKNKKIKNINVQILAASLRCNDSEAEDISSDDEIYLDQLTEPNDRKNEHDDTHNDNDEISLSQEQIEPIDIDDTPIINDNEPIEPMQQPEPEQVEGESEQIQHRSKSSTKSKWAKQKKNKKRNVQLRRYRYRRSVVRRIYDRFPMYLVRRILRLYKIDFTHVKVNKENDLVIGLRKTSKQEAEHNLSMDIFGKRSYSYYRKLYRR